MEKEKNQTQGKKEQVNSQATGQASTSAQPQPASWKYYHEYAQQLYEAGDQAQAEHYHSLAQQLYEASDDEIVGDSVVTRQSVPANAWEYERTSMLPDSFNHREQPPKHKILLLAAIVAVVLIVACPVVYFSLSEPAAIESTDPISESGSTTNQNSSPSSKPSAVDNTWNDSHPKYRSRSRGGSATRKARPDRKAEVDDTVTSIKPKKQKNLSDDPLGGFELE